MKIKINTKKKDQNILIIKIQRIMEKIQLNKIEIIENLHQIINK